MMPDRLSASPFDRPRTDASSHTDEAPQTLPAAPSPSPASHHPQFAGLQALARPRAQNVRARAEFEEPESAADAGGGKRSRFAVSSPRSAPPTREAVALQLLHGMRAASASRVQTTMLQNGPGWKQELESGKPLTVQNISASNLAALHAEFDTEPLKGYEQNFVRSVMDTPLFITHATPSGANVMKPDGSVSLFSRKKLQERGLSFAEKNTTDADISRLANDDHVFFSLEAGGSPQKDSSRFGDRLLRFSFDQQKITDHATLHLVDPLSATLPPIRPRFDAIDDYDDEEMSDEVLDNLECRSYAPADALFHGQDMKIGLALSVVQACRDSGMPEDMARDLLEGEDVNRLVNGLFRPTVMVPRHFFDTPVDEARITHEQPW
ncbi:hypothetical protein ACVBGC_09135 [Burkholderia stagnalis]